MYYILKQKDYNPHSGFEYVDKVHNISNAYQIADILQSENGVPYVVFEEKIRESQVAPYEGPIIFGCSADEVETYRKELLAQETEEHCK